MPRGWTLGKRKFKFFAHKYGSQRNCKRRRREAAIAEGKKPLPTRGLGERRNFVSSPAGFGGAPETDAILNISCQNGVHFGTLLISYYLTIKSKNCR